LSLTPILGDDEFTLIIKLVSDTTIMFKIHEQDEYRKQPMSYTVMDIYYNKRGNCVHVHNEL